MVWPSLISVSDAPGSYFFWAVAGTLSNATTRNAIVALRTPVIVSSLFFLREHGILRSTNRQQKGETMALVTYERDGEIATITLNRPDKLNAFSDELVGALGEELHR